MNRFSGEAHKDPIKLSFSDGWDFMSYYLENSRELIIDLKGIGYSADNNFGFYTNAHNDVHGQIVFDLSNTIGLEKDWDTYSFYFRDVLQEGKKINHEKIQMPYKFIFPETFKIDENESFLKRFTFNIPCYYRKIDLSIKKPENDEKWEKIGFFGLYYNWNLEACGEEHDDWVKEDMYMWAVK